MRGHAGEAGNERADRLAAQGRREALGLPPRAEAHPAPLTGTAALKAAASQATAPCGPGDAGRTAGAPGSIPLDLGPALEVSRAAKAAG